MTRIEGSNWRVTDYAVWAFIFLVRWRLNSIQPTRKQVRDAIKYEIFGTIRNIQRFSVRETIPNRKDGNVFLLASQARDEKHEWAAFGVFSCLFSRLFFYLGDLGIHLRRGLVFLGLF